METRFGSVRSCGGSGQWLIKGHSAKHHKAFLHDVVENFAAATEPQGSAKADAVATAAAAIAAAAVAVTAAVPKILDGSIYSKPP